MKNSKIEWTDHTFNPWIGCTKVSPGCAHCYAETRDLRLHSGAHWGKGAPRTRTSAANWKEPLKWNREAENAQAALENRREAIGAKPDSCWVARRPRVFCASLADWLDDEVPIEWLADLLDLIRRTPNLYWLLLSKRPENWRSRIGQAADVIMRRGDDDRWLFDWVVGGKSPANVWIGTTVEDQKRADERIPHLLKIPTRVRFLSCEPLLGPVDLTKNAPNPFGFFEEGLHWVICGGESGPQARPMHPDWAGSLRDQCKAAGVPFFFKQWGEWYSIKYAGLNARITTIKVNGRKCTRFIDWKDGHCALPLGKKFNGRALDGVEHNEFPKVK